MNLRTAKRTVYLSIVSFLDCLASLFLVFFSILLYPASHLRGIEKVGPYASYLLPRGLTLPAVRAYLDLRLGYYTKAVTAFESLISKLEKEKSKSKRYKNPTNLQNILVEFYSGLAQAYLKAGQIDYAAMIVIRAYNKLGTSNLIGLGELDIKTAHIIRAGLSAGRLLDEGGVATLVVKPSETEKKRFGATKKKNSKTSKPSKEKDLELSDKENSENKVIKFPITGLEGSKLGPDKPTKH